MTTVVSERESLVVVSDSRQGPPGKNGRDGVDGDGLAKEYNTVMQAGVLSYVLPELPRAGTAVVTYINGIKVGASVDGVNLTITEYSAGTIDDTDELSVQYFI